MLDGALSAAAMRAIRVWGLTFSTHVSGYGSVVPTTKPWQMDPFFAWEVWFGFCVDVGGMRCLGRCQVFC